MKRRSLILFVDPAPIFRELGTLFLSRWARVRTAASGREALRLLRRERPDVLVTDLHLPDMDGAGLCRWVRSAPSSRDTAVVVTGARSAQEHALAIRAGASDVLAKPLSRITLVESVTRFLGGTPRGLPRVTLETPVRLSTADGVRWGTVRNLSRGGLFIESPWTPPDLGEIALEFALPDGPPHLAPTALLVWRRDEEQPSDAGPDAARGGMGVRFLALDRDAARSLDRYVHEHAPERPTRGLRAAGGQG